MVIATMKFCLVCYVYHIAPLVNANVSPFSFLRRNLTESFQDEQMEDNLIDTPGCTIPNIWKEYQIVETRNCKNNCGTRAVYVKKLRNSNDIEYIINEHKIKKVFDDNAYECCSQFAYRLPGDIIEYTECMPFQNGTRVKLLHEVITVTCKPTGNEVQKKFSYDDAYIVLKKLYTRTNNVFNKVWNVLILGMDTMSRARAIQSMPKLIKYFKKNSWLDYRGFQKAASNTFPNLMILHTGKKLSTFHDACRFGMDYCNDLMIWSIFKKSGYFTAYGEDHVPDAFSDHLEFKEPPTDHYTRPLFLIGETKVGNIDCLKSKQSAYHVVDYAYQFVKAYKDDMFFGFYWLLTYSNDPNQVPTLLQNRLIKFFNKLNHVGALSNTIIFFLGDHGIRYGRLKIPAASYYDERLPMLFMWFPYSFRDRYGTEYNNLLLNQHRLTTHCDLHSTLWDILKLSDESVTIIPPEFCPQCSSLFEEKSIHRRCEHMNVGARWCSCNALNEVHPNDTAATFVPQTLLLQLINETGKSDLQIKAILRHHWFRQEYDYKDNITYYLIAIQLLENNKQYEAIIKRQQFHFEVLGDIDTISVRESFIDVSHCGTITNSSGFRYL